MANKSNKINKTHKAENITSNTLALFDVPYNLRLDNIDEYKKSVKEITEFFQKKENRSSGKLLPINVTPPNYQQEFKYQFLLNSADLYVVGWKEKGEKDIHILDDKEISYAKRASFYLKSFKRCDGKKDNMKEAMFAVAISLSEAVRFGPIIQSQINEALKSQSYQIKLKQNLEFKETNSSAKDLFKELQLKYLTTSSIRNGFEALTIQEVIVGAWDEDKIKSILSDKAFPKDAINTDELISQSVAQYMIYLALKDLITENRSIFSGQFGADIKEYINLIEKNNEELGKDKLVTTMLYGAMVKAPGLLKDFDTQKCKIKGGVYEKLRDSNVYEMQPDNKGKSRGR